MGNIIENHVDGATLVLFLSFTMSVCCAACDCMNKRYAYRRIFSNFSLKL
jgi:hypothetical protein